MGIVITDEVWMDGLRQFYYDCVNHWFSSFGLGEDDSIKLAIKDCLWLHSWPFSPKGPEMPEEIKAQYHTWLKKESFYLNPISRNGVNRILKKLPNHEYWIKYKACDD